MNCKRVQELILTDYIDQELDEATQSQLRAHLKLCPACRQLEQKVRERISAPFKNMPQVKPPEELWSRIKEAIEEDQARQNAAGLLERLLERARNNFLIRRPAFAFSTVAMVIVAAVLILKSPLQRQILVKDYLSEKSQFMASLQDSVNGELAEYSNFGTAVEEYLF